MIEKVIKLLFLTLFVSVYGANVSVNQVKTSDWNSGFCETVEVTNLGSETIQWEVEFISDGTINNLWNANYTQDSNRNVIATGVSWNSMLNVNETKSFGYCADKVEETLSTDSSKLVLSKIPKNSWASGFCETLKITNNESHDVKWDISTAVDGKIYDLWNANYTQGEDLVLKAQGLSWNEVVKANSSVRFGYCAKVEELTTPNINQEDIVKDKALLTFDVIRNLNTSENNITTHLNLITKGVNNSDITWTSSDVAIISTSGTVLRPESNSTTAIMTLTAIFTKGVEVDSKTFIIIVIKEDDTSRIENPSNNISEWDGNAVSYKLGDLVTYKGKTYKVVLAHSSVANWYPDSVWYFEEQEGVIVSDKDADSIADTVDNCPNIANTDQKDSDNDGLGDVCDDSIIVDTNITDEVDNNNSDSNITIENIPVWDGNAVSYELGDLVMYKGKTYKVILAHSSVANWYPDSVWYFEEQEGVVISDKDADGIADTVDNCPNIMNTDQKDSDNDGLGDVCDDNIIVDTNSTDTNTTDLNSSKRFVVGYLPTWSIQSFHTAEAATSQIATIDTLYTHVIISFAKPDMIFNGTDFIGTGVEFNSFPDGLKQAIEILQARGVKVLLAVGGASYNNWQPLANELGMDIESSIHKKALKSFMDRFNLDGIDVDYEVNGADTANVDLYYKSILALKEVAGDKIFTAAGWSTGADCTVATTSHVGCSGKTSYWGGSAGRERLTFKKLRDNGYIVEDIFDYIAIMTYDGSVSRFDPINLFKNYQKIYAGALAIGFEIPKESWGGAEIVATNAQARTCESSSMSEGDSYSSGGEKKPYSVERFVNFINTVPDAGVMVWSLYHNKNTTICQHALGYESLNTAIKTYLDDNFDDNKTDVNTTNIDDTNDTNITSNDDTILVTNVSTSLTFETIRNQNTSASNILSHLNLITDGGDGVSISWSSDNIAVISNIGVVERTQTDVTVQLTATISKGVERTTKIFTLRVSKEVSSGGFCQVAYVIGDEWSTGATISMVVTNQLANLNSWEVTFSFPSGELINGDLWNGVETQTDKYVSVLNESYNGNVANGGKIEFGFNLTHTGTNEVPTDIKLNGNLCDGQIGGIEKPAKPSNLEAELIGNVKVNLTWTDNSDNEESFIIYQSVDDGIWELLTSLEANVSKYEDISIETDKSYAYKVEAKNIAGGEASDVVTVTPINSTIQSATQNDAVALVANCMACHTQTNSHESIPIIHGLSKSYLKQTLIGYKTSDTTINHYSFAMHRIMDGYEESDIDLMVEYFSSQEWLGNEVESFDVDTITLGKTLFESNCVSCHGSDASQDGIILSKQSEQYLVDTMTNYAKGLHKDAHTGMKSVFENTIEENSTKIEALAKYLAVGLVVPSGSNDTIRGFTAKYISDSNKILLAWTYINPDVTGMEVLVNDKSVQVLNDLTSTSLLIQNDGTDEFLLGETYSLALKTVTLEKEVISESVDVTIKTDEAYGEEHYNTNCKVCHGVNGTARADITQWNPDNHSFAQYTQASIMPASYYSNCDDECLDLIGTYVLNVLAPRAEDNNASSAEDVNSDIARGYRLLNTLEYTNTLYSLFEISANSTRAVTLALEATDLPKDNIVEGYNTDRNLNRIDENKVNALNLMATRVELYLTSLKGLTDSSCLINDYDFCTADKDEFLATFASKIFRRPLSTVEVNEYVALEDVSQIVGDMLVSPKFLYRSEMGVENNATGIYELTQYEIATALAYTISGTTPDDTLLALAKNAELSNANTRVTEAVRLASLQTGKDKLDDFIGRWLLEDDVYSLFDKNPDLFTGYDEAVRIAQSTQILKYFRMVMESSSKSAYSDLFINEWMMTNKTISDYYGENMSSSENFEKVAATSKRYGVLTLGAIASKYANSEESHPFKRGSFVLSRLMCHPLGLPGNGGDVPAIQDHTGENKRNRYAEHVNDPSCATCHDSMDPIGYTWENYDGSGRYRTSEYHSDEDGGAKVIDASVTLKGLLTFDVSETYPAEGIRDVSELIAQSDRGPECMALQYYRYISGDSEAEIENSLVVKKIASDFKDEAYDLQSLFTNIVKLNAFITRTGE